MPTRREVLVGLMFFASLATFFGLALVLAGQTFRVGKQTQEIVVVFPDVSGVSRGTPVLLNGEDIGQVVELIRNRESRQIEVTCSIDKDVQLGGNHTIEILSGLFGGSQIAITDKSSPRDGLVDMNAQLEGQAPVNAISEIAKTAQSLKGIAEQAREIVTQLNITVTAINSTEEGIIGRLLRDRGLADQVDDTVQAVNEMIRTYDRVGKEVLKITDTMQTGDGLLPTLLADSSVSDSVRRMIDDLNVVTGDARAVSSDVRSIIGKVERQEGMIGYLIGDPAGKAHTDAILAEMAQAMPEIRGTMANLNSITYKVDTGFGSVGKMFNDDAMYDQLMNTLSTATRSLEDLRETTPITAFASLLFQAFQ